MATINGTDLVRLFVTPMAIVPNAGDKEVVGAKLLFIPPYGPDLNPIELAFSKLKALLRAKALRTADALWKALGPMRQLQSQGMRQLLPPRRLFPVSPPGSPAGTTMGENALRAVPVRLRKRYFRSSVKTL